MFTSRQIEIIKMIWDGLPDKEIGYRLGIDRRSVEWHIHKAYAMTGHHSRITLCRYALKQGVISQ